MLKLAFIGLHFPVVKPTEPYLRPASSILTLWQQATAGQRAYTGPNYLSNQSYEQPADQQ